MHKFEDDDIKNCASCGYNKCEEMAKAVFNGLNKIENCHYYQADIIELSRKRSIEQSDKISLKIQESSIEMDRVNLMVNELLERTISQSSNIEETTAAVRQMMSAILNVNSSLQERRVVINTLQETAKSKISGLKNMVSSIQEVVDSVDKVQGFNDTIDNVAQNTNLLAMNAAIEAAHAGNHGKGFAVVAGEIRKLAEESGKNAHNIANDLKKITGDIQTSMSVSKENSREMETIITEFSHIADSLTDISANMSQMSAGTEQIQGAMTEMVENSHKVNDFGNSMYEIVKHMSNILYELTELSAHKEIT